MERWFLTFEAHQVLKANETLKLPLNNLKAANAEQPNGTYKTKSRQPRLRYVQPQSNYLVHLYALSW